MFPYICLFCCLVVCAFFETNNVSLSSIGNKSYKAVKRSRYIIVPLIMVLILGIFRETTVGYDSETYYIYYWSQLDRYSWLDLLKDFTNDNGFFLALKVIAIFTDDYWLARAILFMVTFLIYYAAIRDESPYPTISLIIFLGLGSLGLMFGILRQALAGAICLHAYKKIRYGEWTKCLFLILIAITVHKSAILCLFMLMLYFIRAKRFSGIKLVLLSGASYLFMLIVIPLITLFYADGRYETIAMHDGGFGMLIFIISIVVLAAHLMRLTGSNKEDELKFLFNLSSGALFLQMGALQWSLLNRLGAYFSIYWCLLIPKLIYKLPRKKRLNYLFIIIMLFGFLFFYQLGDVDLYVWHKF